MFVVSDFISAPGWEERAGAALAQRHEVVAVRLYDPLEMELPDIGLVTMRDAETGEQLLVDTHDAGFRKRFAAAARAREAALRRGLARAGVDTLELATDDDLLDAILRFADLRRQRSRLAAGGGAPAHLGAAEDRVAEGRVMKGGIPMNFIWPEMLWLLLAVPLLVLLLPVAAAPAQEDRAALRQPGAGQGGAGQERWLAPPRAAGAAAAGRSPCCCSRSARPAAVITLPSQQETIVLAMDVSGSMRATDVLPNRLVASQEAAKAFVAELPRSVRVAVVPFAGTAAVVQPPTHEPRGRVAAIDRFQLQRGTATGSGIVLSLATLFPEAGIDLSQITGQKAMPPGARTTSRSRSSRRCAPGSYSSAAIIMLTDGQRTTGPDPLEAAKMAADRGVRVYTVGIGTKDGETIGFEGWSMRVRLDEDTLKSSRQPDPRRLLLRRHRRRPEEGLPGPVDTAGGREEGDRDQRAVRRARRAARRCRGGAVGGLVRPRGLKPRHTQSKQVGRRSHGSC